METHQTQMIPFRASENSKFLLQWEAFTGLIAGVWQRGQVWKQQGCQMAESASSRLDMCQTPQQTAEMNASHSNGILKWKFFSINCWLVT